MKNIPIGRYDVILSMIFYASLQNVRCACALTRPAGSHDSRAQCAKQAASHSSVFGQAKVSSQRLSLSFSKLSRWLYNFAQLYFCLACWSPRYVAISCLSKKGTFCYYKYSLSSGNSEQDAVPWLRPAGNDRLVVQVFVVHL